MQVNTYELTTTGNKARTVKAEEFETKGDFVDFVGTGDGLPVTVLVVRAAHVASIELQPEG